MWLHCIIKFCLKYEKFVFKKKMMKNDRVFHMNFSFLQKSNILNYIKTEQIKILQYFPENLCTFQKFVFGVVLGNMKKYFLPPLATCAHVLDTCGKP